MASLFRTLRIIARYNWDYYAIRRNMAATEKRYPQSYLVNDFATRDAAGFAIIFTEIPGDIENVTIKEIALYKKKGGSEHELFIITVDYHGETISYGLTERSWFGDGQPSSDSSGYQSPRPLASQKSSMAADVTAPSPSNAHPADDTMFFRSTKALAEITSIHSTLQCTFTPHPGSLQYSLMKLFIICDSFTKTSPQYQLLSTNCYFYTAVILRLLQDIVGGQTVFRKNHTIGKNKGVTIVDLNGEEVSQAAQDTKRLYLSEWAEFEAARSGKKVTMGKTVERTVLPAGTELDATTEQARREIVEEEVISERATEEAARTRRVVTEHEEADEQEQIRAAQAMLAKVTGIPLSQAGDLIANLRARPQSDSGAATEGSSGGTRAL